LQPVDDDANMRSRVKGLFPIAASLWLLAAGPVSAGGPVIRTNDVPGSSELRKDLSWETKDKQLKERILKLIPMGTSEEDAKALFKKHMPPKVQKVFNEGGVAQDLPEMLRDRPYTSYRLYSEYHPLNLSSRWIVVLFFFEGGKLDQVHIARCGVSA
jgi:hypothetical protein